MAVATPSHRSEHTGDALLDRIQANVRSLVQTVAQVIATAEARRTVSMMLASDFTCTEATLQATNLTFAVRKGECWEVEYCGRSACSSVDGMGYGVGAPVGSTISGEVYSSLANVGVAEWFLTAITSISTFIVASHVGASDAGRPDFIRARVKVAADGFITILASSVTAGTTTTISQKSYLQAIKVIEV